MSNTAAVQRIPDSDDRGQESAFAVAPSHDGPAADPLELPPFVLRQQVAERLAAHRARRASAIDSQPAAAVAPAAPSPASAAPAAAADFARSRSAHIAATVAERYAQSISYRNFLAAEAERSVRQAEAAADVANINAKAIAYAQQQLLSDLEHWDPDPEDFALGPVPVDCSGQPGYTALSAAAERQGAEVRLPLGFDVAPGACAVPGSAASYTALPHGKPSFTVRPFEDAAPTPSVPERLITSPAAQEADPSDDSESLLLDEEIAFRQDPSFDEFTREPLPLNVNLLEFPRQLVAARKARPRLAEGPLREDFENGAPEGQLRIFEVHPSQISGQAPDAAAAFDPAGPEWSSILLSAHTHTEAEPSTHPSFVPGTRPCPAPIAHRLMAALVDGAILVGTMAAFIGVFVFTVTHLSGSPEVIRVPLLTGAGAAAALLLTFAVGYHLLFFSVSGATPGMRYARIAPCTFSEESPTRAAMRLRFLYMVLAALPCGLGLLWAFLDEDSLGWHDRLSGIYQRSY